jgi:hypothetical protein
MACYSIFLLKQGSFSQTQTLDYIQVSKVYFNYSAYVCNTVNRL